MKRTVTYLGGAALIAAASIIAVVESSGIRDLVVSRALSLAGATAGAIEGRLLDRLIIKDVVVDSGRIKADAITLAWRPAALLRGRILLEELAIRDVRIALEGQAAAPQGVSPDTVLPLPIRIETFTVEGARLDTDGALAGLIVSAAARVQASGRRLTLTDMQISAVDASDRSLTLNGTAGIELGAELPWSWIGTASARLSRAGARVAAPVDLSHLEASLKLEGTLSSATLNAQLSVPLPVRIAASVPDLVAPMITLDAELLTAQTLDAVTLRSASIRVQGPLDGTSSSVLAEIEVPDPLTAKQLPVALELQSEQDASGLTFTLAGASESLQFEASGQTLLPSGDTRAEIRANLDEQTLRRHGHSLSFDAFTRLGWSPSDAKLHLSAAELTGTLEDRPISLRGHARLLIAPNPRAEELDLIADIGRNRLQIGKATDTGLDVAVRVDLADLAEIDPALSGHGHIEGTVGGNLKEPDLSFSGVLDALSYGQVSVARLQAEVDLEQGFSGAGSVNLALSELAHPSLPAPAFATLVAKGSPDAWPITLDAQSADASVHAEAILSIAPAFERIAGQATVLNLSLPSIGAWSLDAPTTFEYAAASRFSLAATCMKSAPARLCTDAVTWPIADDAGAAIARLNAFPLSRLGKWLPSGMRLDGTLAGNIRYGPTRASLDLEASAFGVELQSLDTGEPVLEDVIESLDLRVERIGDALIGAASMTARSAGSIAIEGRMDRAEPLVESPIAGRAHIDLDTLDLVEPFLDGLADPTGNFQGELIITGRVGQPRLSGNGQGRMRIEIPAIGRALDLPSFSLSGADREGMKIEGAFDVDGTPLTFDGVLAYDAHDHLRGELSLRGDNVPLITLPDLALWLSPQLEAELEDGALSVSGTMGIPRARVAVTSVPETSAARSPDVVIHRDATTTAEPGILTQGRVALRLGNDVQVTAGALSTRLVGHLDLVLALDRSLTAQGRIDTRGGTVSRFGRELAITTGSLAFDGPLTRPDVNVTASRKVNGQEVGVTITGLPDALDSSLFSSPPLDDGAALSMLVTGRSPEDARPEDEDRVSAAAFSLGVGAANPYLRGIGERLGLEELGVDTGTGAIVAGTRLSERLYARYNFALTNGASGLQIEYRISDRLSARTESGPVHALDLLYRREFD